MTRSETALREGHRCNPNGPCEEDVKLPWRDDPVVMYLLIVVLPLVLLAASIVLGMWW
jgi:hypothetical protein